MSVPMAEITKQCYKSNSGLRTLFKLQTFDFDKITWSLILLAGDVRS